MTTYVCDTECFPDFWSISFLDVESMDVQHFYLTADHKLAIPTVRKLLKKNRIVTFNGNNYDLPMIALALAKYDNDDLKTANDKIILNGLKPWDIARAFRIPQLALPDHIDLIEVAPGVASLKVYAGRLHAPVIQNLPIKPDDEVGDQIDKVLDYGVNDLIDTRLLFKKLLPQLKLRKTLSKQYSQDLMSKSDAQIAEAVIQSEIVATSKAGINKPKFEHGYNIQYVAPDIIKFANDELTDLVAEIEADHFIVGDGSGKVMLPLALKKRRIAIGDSKYKMGIGGLHSQEKSIAHELYDDEFLLDFDVASYYPSIILNCQLYPKHLGKRFLDVYRDIVDQRLTAKSSGDKITSEVLKIVINGSFGKFGSKYSILFSPDLLIQTTITGQLALLMLIERVEDSGAKVVSANTDGIVVRVNTKRYKKMRSAIRQWETETQFVIEETQYSKAYFRDVNNYLAFKPDGEHKAKGAYTKAGLAKNPTSSICNDAVINFLKNDTPIYDTVMACDDVRKFVTIRKVMGGCSYGQLELGNAVRWYYSDLHEYDALHYTVNGNKVPRSDGARPLMKLPKKIPEDLDRYWYIREAENILGQIGTGLV